VNEFLVIPMDLSYNICEGLVVGLLCFFVVRCDGDVYEFLDIGDPENGYVLS
jgi:hypothetical protein